MVTQCSSWPLLFSCSYCCRTTSAVDSMQGLSNTNVSTAARSSGIPYYGKSGMYVHGSIGLSNCLIWFKQFLHRETRRNDEKHRESVIARRKCCQVIISKFCFSQFACWWIKFCCECLMCITCLQAMKQCRSKHKSLVLNKKCNRGLARCCLKLFTISVFQFKQQPALF